MPELQMDVAVANRFISSLSKSLQALCHGCMDFDSGIEIVGYINVNIDCGSKVDYVLNEKVLKSTTNSMTFVSNSFLARKEQPKQTRDGACSPIPELNPSPAMSPVQSRSRGYFHGMHPRNVAPVSHSSVHRGAPKRSWPGVDRDWRMSPKKQRDGRPFYPSSHEPGSKGQDAHSNPSSSSHPADSEFKHPQTSFQGSDTSSADGQSEVNIKKEFLENDNDRETADPTEQDQSQTLDQNAGDDSEQASGVANIKRDPDASSKDVDDEMPATDRPENESDDYKDTFLEPSTSEDTLTASEHNRNDSNAHDDSQAVSGGLASEGAAAETPEGAEMQGEYDEGGEEGAYPHSVYSDTGEGSSDAGQFEVIEIDDEDEDVQAMFGGPRQRPFHRGQALPPHYPNPSVPHHSVHARPAYLVSPTSVPRDFQTGANPASFSSATAIYCNFCDSVWDTRSMFQKHMNECHREKNALPFTCPMCQKGFFSLRGLNHHIEAHGGRQFVCSVCHARFQHKHNLKRHVIGVHKLTDMPQC
ncbi:hypothetical protein BsWGS_05449 [Bradybaena similaris]